MFTSRLLKQADYEYSTFQIRYSQDTEKRIRMFLSENLDLDDVYKDNDVKGIEDITHTTVLYGIPDRTPDKLSLGDINLPQEIRWIGLGAFEPEDKPYDVLLIKVEPVPELVAVFDFLNSIYPENANSFPDYVPHTTLAYVKKGTIQKYLAMDNEMFHEVHSDIYYQFAFNSIVWDYDKVERELMVKR